MPTTHDKTRLVFLDQEPLTPRRKKAFELEHLQTQGFHIEFWSLANYCFRVVSIKDTLQEEYTREINTLKEFKQAAANTSLDNTIFIIEGYLALLKPNINSYLIKLGATTIKYQLSTTDSVKKKKFSFERISILSKQELLRLPYTISKILYTKLKHKLHKPTTHIISSGNLHPCDIQINHSDYTLYQESRIPNNRPSNQQYIVFLDQFYPFHPDYESHMINITHNAELFFKDINNFFRTIEKQYNIKVVIAAHPKATYTKEQFNNREIYYGKTNELVQYSNGVITIHSSAISFVIMHNKPLILITTNDIEQSSSTIIQEGRVHQKRIAKIMELNIFNISHPNNYNTLLKPLPTQIRNAYIYTYLTSPGIEQTHNQKLLQKIYNKIILKQY